MTIQRFLFILFISCFSITLTACGGSSSSSGGGQKSQDGQKVSGRLASPATQSETEARMAKVPRSTSAATVRANSLPEHCDDLPSGYNPIANEEVMFLDESGVELDSTTTDDCGVFSKEDVPNGVVSVVAQPAGMREIKQNVEFFVDQSDPSDALVSTISDSAEYKINSFSRQPNDDFLFTVRDTETNKPVLGLPGSAFTLDFNGSDLSFESVEIAARSNKDAAIMLVLDASGSMTTRVAENEDGEDLTRLHLTRMATHLFLDEKAPDDEVGYIIFDSVVNLIDDEFINGDGSVSSRWAVQDENGDEIEVPYSESGFSKDLPALRLIADGFSPFNKIYENPRFGFETEVHPDSPEVTLGRYPFGGSTALWDAVNDGVDALIDNSSAARKVLITMGDGADNLSSKSLNETIDHAKGEGISVQSIFFGNNSDPEEQPFDRGAEGLFDLADKTGGDYTGVEDTGSETKLLEAFQNLQVGIVFQYIGELSSAAPGIQEGETVTLKLDVNGLEASRELTL